MTSRTNRALRLIVIPVATGIAVGALAIGRGPGRFTTYAGRSAPAAALMLAAGLSLVVSGALTMGGWAHRRTGGLAVLVGLTWFAPVWVAWQDGPSLVPSIAMVLSGLTFAFVFHLTIGAPGGTVRPGPVRALISVVYVEAALVALGLALFRDPYFDPGCWANCVQNAFLVHSLPWLTRTIEEADRWFVLLAAVTLIVVCLVRLATGVRPVRAALAPIAVPGMVFAGGAAARVVALQRTTREDPFNGVLFASFVLEGWALILLAAGLIAVIVRVRLQRRAVARIVTELDEAPAAGSLRSALALALGDAELGIVYRLAERGYVDANGRQIDEPVAGNGRANTRFVRDGRTIAVVSHSASLPDLQSEIGPAVLLALENERLQAELLAELEELRASRSRIVETGDSERRRLERDLHDGAQQRLLALSYDIRLARAAAQSAGETRTEALLANAIDKTQNALEGVRDLAHGIYPAILAEAGLAQALATFADTAPLPVELKGVDDRRYAGPVESAVYFSVIEAVADAVDRRAGRVTVTAAHDDARLDVEIADDGSERISSMVPIVDRVGAAGGDVVVEPTRIRVAIPCE